MEPSPKHHPVLSYVMSRFDTKLHLGSKPTTDDEVRVDVDEPPLPPEQLIKKMPHLNHPKVLSSMTQAIFEVSQTRSLLRTLGDRPDHEAVDIACEKITEIESTLSNQLQKFVLVPRPDNVDRMEWRDRQAEKEKDCRQAAEKEKCIYKAVVHLEEMHEVYEKLLKDAEERLVKIYGSAARTGEEGEEIGSWDNVDLGEEKVNEDVVGILQNALGKGLEKVELSERNLKFLPEAFGRLDGLIVLDLSCNQLEVIPDSIAGLEKLEEFNLSSNILESLPDSIGLLFNLKILNVSGNKLKSLPDSISRCRSLEELDASFNALTYLPTNIGHELIHLKRLSIQLNKIRSLPTSVCEMASLCHLDAHFNELHGLPFAIGKLTNLKTLNLSNNFNDMTKLPDTFGDMTNLRELDLGNNQIHALPDTFGQLQNLTKLNLDQNPLVVPPMKIVSKGIEAINEFMVKRSLDRLLGEEQRSIIVGNNQAQTGWLTHSTSWLNNWVSVSDSEGKSPQDSYLEQKL